MHHHVASIYGWEWVENHLSCMCEAKQGVMERLSIPTVNLSPFFQEGNLEARKEAIQTIRQACEDSGFFQIVNHGVPPSLMSRAIELSKAFFNYPKEEKLKSKAIFGLAPLPVGYSQQPESSTDRNEYLLMFAPDNTESGFARFNVLPDDPPEFRGLLEELCTHLRKTSLLVEGILNECMGLPSNFLEDYNSDRSSDFLLALRYFPVSGAQNTGLSEHQDGNCLTYVFQDDTEGLQVLKDGQWLTVIPTEGTIIVNVGDVIQVLSNNKFKSATHRVVSNERSSRYSYAFFNNIDGEKWVEPLPQFTEQIGEPAQYKGFWYKDYQQQRMRNKSHPPDKPEHLIHISYYAI